MKRLGNFLLAFILFITAILTIASFSIQYIIAPDTTAKVIQTATSEEIIDEVVSSNTIDDIYQEANRYGINKTTMDQILQDETTKQLLNDLVQQFIQDKLQNESTKIEDIAAISDRFIEDIITHYQVPISKEQEEELKQVTSQNITTEMNQIVQVKDSEKSIEITNFITSFTNSTTKTILIILLVIEIISILLLNWKEKTFVKIWAIVSLFCAIFVLGITGVFQVIFDVLSPETQSITTLLKPIFTDGYYLGAIILIVSIILFTIHYFIQKRKKEYEAIPF